MSLFRQIVFIAALAGLLGGVVMTGLQAASTVPLILKAESFETAGEPAAHEHAPGTAAHEHSHDDWSPADGAERVGYTALANVATAIGFAVLLVAASELAGGLAGWRQGVFWGLAGFATFTLAPGLGLPPELPAMPAADLAARQLWWVGTVAATGAGLALLVFKRSLPLAILAVALIVAPHLIGAPQPESFETPVPHSLAHDFMVAVAVSSLIFWVVLGGAAGLLRQRFMRAV
jgi:cobalt transporter subunit CbtA